MGERPGLKVIKRFKSPYLGTHDLNWEVKCHACGLKDSCNESDEGWSNEEFYDWLVKEGWTFEKMPGREKGRAYCPQCKEVKDENNSSRQPAQD